MDIDLETLRHYENLALKLDAVCEREDLERVRIIKELFQLRIKLGNTKEPMSEQRAMFPSEAIELAELTRMCEIRELERYELLRSLGMSEREALVHATNPYLQLFEFLDEMKEKYKID